MKSMMKERVFDATAMLCVILLSAASSGLSGPEPNTVAEAWAPDLSGAAQYAYGVDTVTVSFPPVDGSTIPPDTMAELAAGVGSRDPAFTGNYVDSEVKGLAFRLAATGAMKPRVVVVIEAEIDSVVRRWYNTNVEISDVDGVWELNNISLDFVAGWTRDGRKNTASFWAGDLQHVTAVGLIIKPQGAPAQTCSIKEFQLLKANQVATPVALLEDKLPARFPGGVDRSQDKDGDGISDVDEIMMTETDPDDPNSALVIKVTRAAEGGVAIEWRGVAAGRYRVLYAADPGDTFTARMDNVEAMENGPVRVIDGDGTGTGFYRVQQLK